MSFEPIAQPITLKEDANDNLQTRFIETIFSDFLREPLSHCTGAAGLKLRPLELCSRFEAGRRRPGAASQGGTRTEQPCQGNCSPALLDINLSCVGCVDTGE